VTQAVRGDVELADRLLRELRVAGELPAPGLEDYLSAMTQRFLGWLSDRGIDLPELATPERVAQGVIVALGIVVVILLLRLRREVQHDPVRRASGATRKIPRPPEPRRAEDWLAALETRVRSGDARGALEALWWWLAGAVGFAQADPSWTLRDLLRRSGRSDLFPFASELERLSYGPIAPRPAEVRELLRRLRARLA